jgi:hypothetical protein
MRRTKQDAEELSAARVQMRKQDAAGLQNCQKLSQSSLWERGQEWLLCLGHTELENGFIVVCSVALHCVSPDSKGMPNIFEKRY